MTLKNFTFGLALAALALNLSSCNKSKNWESSVVLQTKTYNSIAVDATYDIKGNKNEVEVGVCWDDEPNPNLDDGSMSTLVTGPSTADFVIDDLYANTVYYFRPFIYSTDGTGLNYGEEMSFATDQVPDFDNCTLTPGQVEDGTSTYSMGNLSGILLPDHYKLSVATTDFDFNFYFGEEPQSGKYAHDPDNILLQPFKYYMTVQVFDGGSNCTYNTALNEPLNVINNNGQITLSFCELHVGTTGSCTSTLLLSGSLLTN